MTSRTSKSGSSTYKSLSCKTQSQSCAGWTFSTAKVEGIGVCTDPTKCRISTRQKCICMQDILIQRECSTLAFEQISTSKSLGAQAILGTFHSYCFRSQDLQSCHSHHHTSLNCRRWPQISKSATFRITMKPTQHSNTIGAMPAASYHARATKAHASTWPRYVACMRPR